MASQTINGYSYILNCRKDNFIPDTFMSFFVVISKNVSDPKNRTKFIFPTWPNIDINDSSAYPIIIVEPPEIRWTKMTYSRMLYSCTINIAIFSTSMQQLDTLASEVLNAIREDKDIFRKLNIYNLLLEDISSDHITRDEFVVHIKDIRFTFEIIFDHD